MTDYNELVKALRSASTVSTAFGKLMADAADAIEALQAEIRESMQRCAECGDELAHQMPKLGEWKTTRPDAPMFGFYYCSICGRKRTSPQDNYCPNCGAKMEVQDGQ